MLEGLQDVVDISAFSLPSILEIKKVGFHLKVAIQI